RMTCKNNLKQIGLAFHSYHDTYYALPSAGSGDSGNPPTDRRDWGWTYDILPFIEQQALYKNPSNSAIRATPIKIYYCPSRRTFAGLPARADYAGCGATRANSDGFDGLVVKSPGSKGSFKRGTVQMNAGCVPDGLSNTLMVGEKRVNFATMYGSPTDFTDNESW